MGSKVVPAPPLTWQSEDASGPRWSNLPGAFAPATEGPYPVVGSSNDWEPHALDVDGVLLSTARYEHGWTTWQHFGCVRASVPYRPDVGLAPLLLELAARARELGANAVLGLDIDVDPWGRVQTGIGSGAELRRMT